MSPDAVHSTPLSSRDSRGICSSADQAALGECQNPQYNSRMSALRVVLIALFVSTLASAQQTVSFPTEDGGRVCSDLYGQGSRAVVLAHGGRFNKESWREQAQELASKGFRILAIDFRGFGCSTGPGQSNWFFLRAELAKNESVRIRFRMALEARRS
jgi:alpha/beta hydrolase fold